MTHKDEQKDKRKGGQRVKTEPLEEGTYKKFTRKAFYGRPLKKASEATTERIIPTKNKKTVDRTASALGLLLMLIKSKRSTNSVYGKQEQIPCTLSNRGHKILLHQ